MIINNLACALIILLSFYERNMFCYFRFVLGD